MKIPTLNFKNSRDREFRNHSNEQKSNVLKKWLIDGLSHRAIDTEVLYKDAKKTKGFISMGILHHLGLKKEFQGLFKAQTPSQAVEFLKVDSQDFNNVITLLNFNKDSNEERFFPDHDLDIEENVEKIKNIPEDLLDLNETDGFSLEVTKYRNEQGLLRALMFGEKKKEVCALCHKIYPVEFLWVAHIKPRSDCTEAERLDKNIAMPACKFGCDDMFEKGYILVDEAGDIIKNEDKYQTTDLSQKILEVIGKKCKAFNNNTSKYFDSRRKVFQNKKPQVANILKDAYSETTKK